MLEWLHGGLLQTRHCGKTVRSEREDPNFRATSWRLPRVGTAKGTKKGLKEDRGEELNQTWWALPDLSIVSVCRLLDEQGAALHTPPPPPQFTRLLLASCLQDPMRVI